MRLTRRQFLAGSGAVAGLGALGPLAGRWGAALANAADPATADRRRLVIVYQQGGNDGLNMVVPRADVAGAPRYSVYRRVRPTIGHDASVTLPLQARSDDAAWELGLHPKLTALHGLYAAGRVAIVQGVDYPDHQYSHFESTDIWESGLPGSSFDSGWIGRHLDRSGIGAGELRAVALGTDLPLALRGQVHHGVTIAGLPLGFSDGTGDLGDARHAALRSFGEQLWPAPLARAAAREVEQAVATVDALEAAPAAVSTSNPLANDLLAARTLLTENLGVEVVFVRQSGYDTHAGQLAQQEALLDTLDGALEAFFHGTLDGADLGIGALPSSLAEKTLVMTTSEFGRRIGETGVGAAAGTDHGAAAPLFLIGPPGLTGGIHGDHPEMGSVALPADNLMMTTDVRRVYQAVLQQWLGDPDPRYEGSFEPLPGLLA